MTKNVGILIFDEVEVLDFAGPFEVFSVTENHQGEKPFNTFTISKSMDPIKSVNGLVVIPNYSFEMHPPIDILVLSGGQGTRSLLEDDALLRWVRNTLYKAECTLGICSAARLLAKLGLLDNKAFCTHQSVYEHVVEISPTAIPNKKLRFIQTDTSIYTSGGISAGIDLSIHIVEKYCGPKIAKETANYMEYTLLM